MEPVLRSPEDDASRRAFRREWLPGIRAADFRQIVATEIVGPLSESQLGLLLYFYALEEVDRDPERGRGDAERLRYFLAHVKRIRFDIERGGRAVLRDPEVSGGRSPRSRFEHGAGYRVEFGFEQVGRDRHLEAKQARVIADRHLMWENPPNLRRYYAAMLLGFDRLDDYEDFRTSAPPTAPTAGQPPKTDFYRWLLGRERELLRAGDPAPGRTIAEQLDKNQNTVRSWLKRARTYIREEETR